jgi:hypothetical protein
MGTPLARGDDSETAPHDLATAWTPGQIVESLKVDWSPRNICACLPSPERDYFDRDYRQAKATEELDLTSVHDLLAYWWHIARMKAIGEFDEIIEHAAHIQEQIVSGSSRAF